jgi:hypothetical protein
MLGAMGQTTADWLSLPSDLPGKLSQPISGKDDPATLAAVCCDGSIVRSVVSGLFNRSADATVLILFLPH